MELVASDKISQISATDEGVRFLRRLAGRSDDSGAVRDDDVYPTAPFEEMKDAYRALFVYGLLNGERLPPGEGQKFSTIYAQISMLSGHYDFTALLKSIGREGDLEDVGRSVNEYTNWAIEKFRRGYSPESFNLLLE